jgi:cellulose synthase/poly-beta-1,6-N-acetylglucosamine synthase-like glycosyltransferase
MDPTVVATGNQNVSVHDALSRGLEDDLTIADYAQAVDDAGEKLVSVIIPCSNDRRWILACFDRVAKAFEGTDYRYELIVVDDRSHDGTLDVLRSAAGTYPLRIIEKRGPAGRSMSIKEGLDVAVGRFVVLLDPDVVFPTDGFQEMLQALSSNDVVVANRPKHPFILRRLYRWVCGRALLRTDADIRSGLKMFRRSLLSSLRFNPLFDGRIGFDIFLLYHAKSRHVSTKIVVMKYVRPLFHHGVWTSVTSRIDLVVGVMKIVAARTSRALFPFLYPPQPQEYFEAGFTNVNDYLFLAPKQSAKGHITRETISLSLVVFLICSSGLYVTSFISGFSVLVIGATLISFVYVAFMTFKLVMLFISVHCNKPRSTQHELDALSPNDCPMISILIPLYKEGDIIPQIFRYLLDFDYPVEKLDVIFIFESTDKETADAFLAMNPPAHFKALLSPDVQPKTKPKAMNVAFKESQGSIVVIFDAEVLPERDQLKKAVLLFKKYPDAMYLHSKMDVYNSSASWISLLYTSEFCYFYNFFLPGIVECNYPLPISGHSTYFRREVIEHVGAWDPYNVAEDCDIGIRIFRKGYRSGMMLDSYTWEQSTTTIPTWVRQRTRWIQGFIQTSIVQLRYPLLLKRQLHSWWNFVVFLILVPGNVLLNILNIFQWSMFALWHFTHAPFLQDAYIGFTLYLATVCFFFGNFLFTFFGMYALYERKHYSAVPWSLLMVVYWIMLGIATIRSTLHFFLHPHKWDKTKHTVAVLKNI